MSFYIYEIKSKSTGQVYIGITKNIPRRFYEHYKNLIRNKHNNCNLQKHFNKYGATDFLFDVVDKFNTADEAFKEESLRIKKRNNLFNINGNADYLKEKRSEFVHALTDQGYTGSQLARLFNTDRVTIKRIKDARPKDYKTKWVKVI